MKSRIVSLIAAGFFTFTTYAQTLVFDPTVWAAIEAMRSESKEIGEKQEEQMTKMQAAQALVAVELEKIHKIEDQWLDYLKTCDNTVQNLQQIWNIAKELYDLPNNLNDLLKAMEYKPSGAVKESAVLLLKAYHKDKNSLIMKVPATINNCKVILGKLVLNGKSAISKDSLNIQFNVEGNDNMSYHEASLLNSYERIGLLNQLQSELSSLNWRIRCTITGVKYATWWDVLEAFDWQTYSFYVNSKYICERVIRTFY